MDKKTSEIAKLTERVSQDPKSKLFVPLAEEYKKAGDREMAIHVLREGLKNNPGYATARSFLGKLLMEQGDYPGAQKEFEEVVKATPDNLMAHKKLGDLCALQDRIADALNHYKTTLSLNPKDQETAMLIAEAEAGRDIKQHLGMQKSVQPEQFQGAKTESIAVPPETPHPVQPEAATNPDHQPAQPAADFLMEDEEPEEVIVVESLEPIETTDTVSTAGSDTVLTAENMNFLAETGQDLGIEPAEKTDLFSDETPFVTDGSAIQEAGPIAGEIAQETPGEASEDRGKQADDFTTDTLAELYISQGFFEKAIDIYERMLVDNPNSQGLKDKLANVRAMAASAAGHEQEAETDTIEVSPSFAGDTDFAEPAQTSETDGLLQSEGVEPPRLDEWELSETRAVPAAGAAEPQPPRKPAQSRTFETDFEPKEYIPPDAVLKQKQEVPGAQRQNLSGAAGKPDADISSKQTAASKQQTVERLESWLKNIKKER